MAHVHDLVAEREADTAGTRDEVSFCRICSGGCGTIVTVGADGRIAAIKGDRDNPLSRGHACFKGLQSGASHHAPARLLRPLARSAAGEQRELPLEQALDAITDRLRPIITEHGPDAVAMFCGNGSLLHATSYLMQRAFMAALGSPQFYTTLTIDQSAKLVSYGRLGAWAGGMPELEQMEVAIMFGTNPLVSHSSLGFLTADPVKRLKEARQRGMKLVTVDPRMSETAAMADIALQPLPGWDPAICAAIIRLLLDRGAYDTGFCERHVGAERMAALRLAVEPFTADDVERGAGLKPGELNQVADLIAQAHGFVCAYGATGPNMAPFSNLAQHLIDTINVIRGSFLKAGDRRTQVIVQDAFAQPVAQVIGADRPWDSFPASRIRGVGNFFGERLSATLADEILTPGEGRIRALVVMGGDPATSLPGRERTIEALESLDLLVSVDPFPGPTASMADFVLPPLLQYERADVTAQIPGYPLWPGRWAQYTPAIMQPPTGSDIADDWYMLWALAKRLGLQLDYAGHALSSAEPPATDELIAMQLAGSQTSLDGLRTTRHGLHHDLGEVRVQPAPPGGDDRRFDVMPSDVGHELLAFRQQAATRSAKRPFLLAVRRMRDFFNSNGVHNPRVRARNPANPLFIHPDDMTRLGLSDGERIAIQSDHGEVTAPVSADPTMRPGVVALSHGWGGKEGSCVNTLISAHVDFETINAMPHMSALPVSLRRADATAR